MFNYAPCVLSAKLSSEGFDQSLSLSRKSYLITIIAIFFQNEQMAEAVYGCLWYHLPSNFQKQVCILIQHLQNGPATIVPFGHINFLSINSVWQKLCRKFNPFEITNTKFYFAAFEANLLVFDVFDEFKQLNVHTSIDRLNQWQRRTRRMDNRTEWQKPFVVLIKKGQVSPNSRLTTWANWNLIKIINIWIYSLLNSFKFGFLVHVLRIYSWDLKPYAFRIFENHDTLWNKHIELVNYCAWMKQLFRMPAEHV